MLQCRPGRRASGASAAGAPCWAVAKRYAAERPSHSTALATAVDGHLASFYSCLVHVIGHHGGPVACLSECVDYSHDGEWHDSALAKVLWMDVYGAASCTAVACNAHSKCCTSLQPGEGCHGRGCVLAGTLTPCMRVIPTQYFACWDPHAVHAGGCQHS